MSGFNLDGINHEAVRGAVGNICHTKVGLAIHGTTKHDSLTAAAAAYTVNGVHLAYAADTIIEWDKEEAVDEHGVVGATGVYPTLADDYRRKHLVVLDASGNLRLVCGEAVPTGETADWPNCPLDHCVIGGIEVDNQAGYVFLLGDATYGKFDDTGVTTTFTDLSSVPA